MSRPHDSYLIALDVCLGMWWFYRHENHNRRWGVILNIPFDDWPGPIPRSGPRMRRPDIRSPMGPLGRTSYPSFALGRSEGPYSARRHVYANSSDAPNSYPNDFLIPGLPSGESFSDRISRIFARLDRQLETSHSDYERERALRRLKMLERFRIAVTLDGMADRIDIADADLNIAIAKAVALASATYVSGAVLGKVFSASAVRQAAAARSIYAVARTEEQIRRAAAIAARAQNTAGYIVTATKTATGITLGISVAAASGEGVKGIIQTLGVESADLVVGSDGMLGVSIEIGNATIDRMRAVDLPEDYVTSIVMDVHASIEKSRNAVRKRYGSGP